MPNPQATRHGHLRYAAKLTGAIIGFWTAWTIIVLVDARTRLFILGSYAATRLVYEVPLRRRLARINAIIDRMHAVSTGWPDGPRPMPDPLPPMRNPGPVNRAPRVDGEQ